ncbi:MAG: hypothetical protein ACPGMQ_10020 [Pirellulales bacterium]
MSLHLHARLFVRRFRVREESTEEHRFRINDANFGAEQGADIRIKVEGASPLLGMVVIASPAAQK